ncbi:MAG TPA: phage holin family protein [Oscillospiraceae bacterium]|jgi:hypothetical protein|nr:phage holin family protein [Oscillospiraceae bacterium]
MEIFEFIRQEALILIPALYTLGMIFKNTKFLADRYIPLALLPFGLAGSLALMGPGVQAAIQGVLITGFCVYGNQIVKQFSK